MNRIYRTMLSALLLLAVVALSSSCDHKTLYERMPVGTERKVRLNIDWSQLETADDLPSSIIVAFYDKATGECEKFEIKHDEESKELKIPSGEKHIYIYNSDDASFTGYSSDKCYGENFLMSKPYYGINKLYFYSADVTINAPEVGVADDVQILDVKPACATPHVNITLRGIEKLQKHVKSWVVTLSGMQPAYYPYNNAIAQLPSVFLRSEMKPSSDGLTLSADIRTFGFHPSAYEEDTPAILYLHGVANDQTTVDLKLNIMPQVRASEQLFNHVYVIIADIEEMEPVDVVG